MDLPFFFIDTIQFGHILTLNEETSKHIVQVLRMKPLEKLQLTDGAGNLLTAEIVEDHKKKCTVRILSSAFIPHKNEQISVGISLIKNVNRFEWFLEKATEVGVSEIIPLLCERTEKQHFRFERMQQIVISAMLQSKQCWLPVLSEPGSLKKVIGTSDYDTKFIAHCEEEIKVPLSTARKGNKVQVLIGPEGDFSHEEIVFAEEKGYLPVSLGQTRLRTETAGVAAAILLAM